MSEEPERHSHALEPELVADPDEIARIEARNGVRQFDAVTEMIEYYSHPERNFKLRPSQLLNLHRIALDGLSSYAGNWRPAGIEIKGSKHQPVGAHLVAEEIEHMCDYVNDNWEKSLPLHLAAYALWKLNWIHPFTDGNGRTARAFSYLLLSLRLGYRLRVERQSLIRLLATRIPTTRRWKPPTRNGNRRSLTCRSWRSCSPTCSPNS